MSLTSTQLVTLKSAILAETDPTFAAARQANDEPAMAAFFNAATATLAWRTNVPISEIINSINWASYTPNDKVASGDTDPALSRKIGWLLEIQVKQMNLQLFLQGQQLFNSAPPNMRGGLRDAVIQVPSGASGAATSPGGANGATTLAACTRAATRGELVFAAASQGSDTTGSTTARVLTFQGSISAQDVSDALRI